MSFIKNTTVHNIFSGNWAYSDTSNVIVNMLDSDALSPISSELSPMTATDDLTGGVVNTISKNETLENAIKKNESKSGYF